MTRSITQNAIYNVLLNIAAVIFPVITAPYVSRVLEPDGVGLYNFATTYAGYFALVAMLGIPTYGVREVSKNREDKSALTRLISELMSIAVVTTIGVSFIYLVTIALIGQLTENYIIFLIAGFAIYLAPLKINWFYQGIEDFGFITKVSLIVKTISVICLFIFVRDKNDLIIYIILSVLGSAMADAWNFIKMWRSDIHPYFTIKCIRPHIKPLLVLFASSIAISIYTILDTLMLGFMTDYDEVGYYTNAMHMSKVIMTAVTSLSIVAVPRVSYYMKNKDYDSINLLMNKSFFSVLAFPVAIVLMCIAPTFVPLFLGLKFTGAVLPLMILSLLIIAIGLNNLTGVQMLIGIGLDKLILYSVLTGTITNFLMHCFFIPIWGAVGASISSVIAEIIILFVTIYFVYHNTCIRIDKWLDIVKAFTGTLIFLPLILFLKRFLEGWWLVCCFAVLGCTLYLVVEILLRNKSVDLFKGVIFSRVNKYLNKD